MAATKIMGNSDNTLKCWQCEFKNVDMTAMHVILGTLRYHNAAANGNVMAEEGLGIEHCAYQLCHRLTLALHPLRGLRSTPSPSSAMTFPWALVSQYLKVPIVHIQLQPPMRG